MNWTWVGYAVFVVLAVYAASVYFILLRRLPEEIDKRMRQVLADYSAYSHKRRIFLKREARLWKKMADMSLENEYKHLELERAHKKLEIRQSENESAFRRRIESFDDLYSELDRIEKEINAHPDRRQIRAEQLAKFKKEDNTDRPNDGAEKNHKDDDQ